MHPGNPQALNDAAKGQVFDGMRRAGMIDTDTYLDWLSTLPADQQGVEMDTRTGEMYPTKADALAAGVPEARIVTGPAPALRKLSAMVKSRNRRNAERKARRQQQQRSRKVNRGRR